MQTLWGTTCGVVRYAAPLGLGETCRSATMMTPPVPASTVNSQALALTKSEVSPLFYPSSPHRSLCTVTPSGFADSLKSGLRQHKLLFNTTPLLPGPDHECSAAAGREASAHSWSSFDLLISPSPVRQEKVTGSSKPSRRQGAFTSFKGNRGLRMQTDVIVIATECNQ